MSKYYIEETVEYMGLCRKGTLIEATSPINAKKMASKMRQIKNSCICLYEVTNEVTKSCKKIAVLSNREWRNISTGQSHKGVW